MRSLSSTSQQFSKISTFQVPLLIVYVAVRVCRKQASHSLLLTFSPYPSTSYGNLSFIARLSYKCSLVWPRQRQTSAAHFSSFVLRVFFLLADRFEDEPSLLSGSVVLCASHAVSLLFSRPSYGSPSPTALRLTTASLLASVFVSLDITFTLRRSSLARVLARSGSRPLPLENFRTYLLGRSDLESYRT
jgi:hypothetical protein